VIGFVAGAAAAVVGDDADSLHAELLRLEQQASRAAAVGLGGNAPPDPGASKDVVTILPVEDLIAPRIEYTPPAFSFADRGIGTDIFSGILEQAVQPFGTIEELLELVRAHVAGPWDSGQIVPRGCSYIVRAPQAVADRARAYLDETLRPLVHRTVVVDFEVWTKPGRTGKRLLSLRAAGTIGTPFHVWSGGQTALWIDSDVDVATRLSVSDPVVDVAQTGAMFSVRAQAVAGSRDLILDLDLRTRQLEQVRSHPTRQAGMLELPRIATREASMILPVRSGSWVLATQSSPSPGERRFWMVRATLQEREALR
jgi:hypothetical protein